MTLNKRTPLTVAGIIFLIMAIVHLARYFIKFGLVIAGYDFPLTGSLAASIILFVLAIWMFLARR